MDITPLFKACVKTVRTRNKAFGVHSDSDKNRILKNKPKSGFMTRAKDITLQITKLRDFLSEKRSAYLQFSNFSGTQTEMTDFERDQIDEGARRVANVCSHAIGEFKKDARKLPGGDQICEFRDAILKSVEAYLKAVCALQAERKAARIKRAADVRKLSKLETEVGEERDFQRTKSLETVDEFPTRLEGDTTRETPPSDSKISPNAAAELEASVASEDDRILSEELQMFESENLQLYNELNGLSEEVKRIESKVLHISELQEAFTEKVLQQDHDVDRISGTVIGVNENVRDANEQIRQAIQRNAGLRVWVLFFLLVMSFTLLFLDWYND